MKIRELRNQIKMTQKELSDYLDIPVRTIQDWEGERRTPPDYVLELIEYKIKGEGKMEKLILSVGYKEYMEFTGKIISKGKIEEGEEVRTESLRGGQLNEYKIDVEKSSDTWLVNGREIEVDNMIEHHKKHKLITRISDEVVYMLTSEGKSMEEVAGLFNATIIK